MNQFFLIKKIGGRDVKNCKNKQGKDYLANSDVDDQVAEAVFHGCCIK